MRDFNPKIPILMYHEVSSEGSASNDVHRLTPLYEISEQMFENHLKMLSREGYKGLHLNEVAGVREPGRYVVLTFDDGLKGNFTHAFPLLQKYGFKATIFVATDRISTDRFMDWGELAVLASNGISIQSHTMSHRPLQTLGLEEAFAELDGSRRKIECELGTKVDAVSFPHGSYKKETLEAAKAAGYAYICTSDVDRVYYKTVLDPTAVLGRIAVTSKMDEDELRGLIEYDGVRFLMLICDKKAKKLAKKAIGIERYRRLYRWFFNIKTDNR